MSSEKKINGNGAKRSLRDVLASMELFCVLSALIAVWFSVSLGLYPKYSAVFDRMDKSVLIHWLTSDHFFSDPVRFWFVSLVFLIFLLGVNLFLCILDDLSAFASIARIGGMLSRTSLLKLSVLITHLSYIIILSGHLTTAITGYRVSFDIKSGATLDKTPAPFAVRCDGIETFTGGKGRVMMIAKAALNPGGTGEKTVMLKQGKTIWYKGVMIDVEAVTSNPAGTSSGQNKTPNKKGISKEQKVETKIRLTKNYGLFLDAAGSILFFIGIAMRLILRKTN